MSKITDTKKDTIYTLITPTDPRVLSTKHHLIKMFF